MQYLEFSQNGRSIYISTADLDKEETAKRLSDFAYSCREDEKIEIKQD
jgi:hypothetical protein